MLTLYFKRAKLFLRHANGEQRFVSGPTKEGPIQVPAWVAETDTYKLSIKDGSIVNLTPPEPVVQHVAAEPVIEPVAEPVTDPVAETTEDDEDEAEDEAPIAKPKPSRAGKGAVTANSRAAK